MGQTTSYEPCVFNQTTFSEIMRNNYNLAKEFAEYIKRVNASTGLLTANALNSPSILSNGTTPAKLNHIDLLKLYCHQYPIIPEYAHFFIEFYYVMIPKEKNCTPKLPDGDPFTPLWVNIFITMIFFIIGVIGIVGNLLTVWVIYKNKSLQTHTNYFLASLALSDLLLILVQQSPFFTFVSILTIVALTGERYTAICKPFSILKFNKQRVRRIIYLIWVVAFIPSLYLGMQYKQVVEDFCGYNRDLGVGLGYCDYVTSPNDLFRFPFELAMVITFVLPMIFIMYCYMRILQTLNTTKLARNLTVHIPLESTRSESIHNNHRSSLRESIREKFSGAPRRSQQDSNSQGVMQVHHKLSVQMTQQAHRMVIKILVTVSMTFFICYLPYHLERLIAQYIKNQCKQSLLCLLLYPITGLLQYVSATLNPIFYNLMSDRFRAAFKSTFENIFRSPKEYQNINGASQRLAMRVIERRGTRCTELLSTESPM
ncbi:unnamed protein product, partial [Mesorhabditis belari]|uniref:G-protein coupled receptors family 1 profile domain-containing protein n=1 Tax=Mesorhabditis belari TaxID=2138241 RepID=A0AAF3FK57_9BILA